MGVYTSAQRANHREGQLINFISDNDYCFGTWIIIKYAIADYHYASPYRQSKAWDRCI